MLLLFRPVKFDSDRDWGIHCHWLRGVLKSLVKTQIYAGALQLRAGMRIQFISRDTYSTLIWTVCHVIPAKYYEIWSCKSYLLRTFCNWVTSYYCYYLLLSAVVQFVIFNTYLSQLFVTKSYNYVLENVTV